MISPKHKWYTPVLLFAWSCGWVYFAISALATREFGFRWTRGAEHLVVRPDTYPYHFWGCVSLAFALAGVGVCAAVRELRRFLQERK